MIFDGEAKQIERSAFKLTYRSDLYLPSGDDTEEVVEDSRRDGSGNRCRDGPGSGCRDGSSLGRGDRAV